MLTTHLWFSCETLQMADRLEADRTLARAIRVILNHFDNLDQAMIAELQQTQERLQEIEATNRRIQRNHRERMAAREAAIASQQIELEQLREENAALEWEVDNNREAAHEARRDHERTIQRLERRHRQERTALEQTVARLEAQLAAPRAAS